MILLLDVLWVIIGFRWGSIGLFHMIVGFVAGFISAMRCWARMNFRLMPHKESINYDEFCWILFCVINGIVGSVFVRFDV